MGAAHACLFEKRQQIDRNGGIRTPANRRAGQLRRVRGRPCETYRSKNFKAKRVSLGAHSRPGPVTWCLVVLTKKKRPRSDCPGAKRVSPQVNAYVVTQRPRGLGPLVCYRRPLTRTILCPAIGRLTAFEQDGIFSYSGLPGTRGAPKTLHGKQFPRGFVNGCSPATKNFAEQSLLFWSYK